MDDGAQISTNTAVLLGETETHLIYMESFGAKVHIEAVLPLQKLATRAAEAGFDLGIASSFRSFERQLLIWNGKANGTRPVLDQQGQTLDITTLPDREKLYAILLWSALPGTSRHHWGTDVDVFDRSRIPEGYQLQLTVAETEAGGPFADFHQWLTQDLQTNGEFYRPYVAGVGSISPEPWHLSYAPIAQQYAAQFTLDMLREKILATDIALKETILKNLDDIFDRYVKPYSAI